MKEILDLILLRRRNRTEHDADGVMELNWAIRKISEAKKDGHTGIGLKYKLYDEDETMLVRFLDIEKPADVVLRTVTRKGFGGFLKDEPALILYNSGYHMWPYE